ncbi:hypothetical protein [Agromyces sp. NBRC 114283]|uniref:hypothetical protein n=1 Tax=Agromyces sp. NBRC 114283 TaxID=2994521 RepID=UPI0025562644|nr:hypothetical protein [Agromyces sp. NBRC 114283]
MELLYFRLTGQFDRIETRPKTKEAEERLGLERSAYFYVDRAHPDYGDMIVANDGPVEVATWCVSPFDTGGLAHGWIRTRVELDEEQRRRLLGQWTWDDLSYERQLNEWISGAFRAPDDYVEAGRPGYHLVEEVDLPACDSQSWTFEGRIPVDGLRTNPVAPVRAYVTPGKRQHYLEWVRASRRLSIDQYTEHLRLVATVVVETASPIESVRSDILASRGN